MGRETRILLSLVGLLAGVFVGVVSLKLFVPRPPAGVGPDVHGDVAAGEAQQLVEPPDLAPVPTAAASVGEARASRSSRFTDAAATSDHVGDPFVSPASFRESAAAAGGHLAEPLDLRGATPAREPAPAPTPPPPAPRFEPPAPPPAEAAAAVPQPGDGTEAYVTRPGDSWWSLAERAYGDGRLYRALFAWNRSLDARVSLVPGTRLELPPAARLAAAWPALVPRN